MDEKDEEIHIVTRLNEQLKGKQNYVKLFAAKPRITKKIEEEWSEAERPEADEIFVVIRGGAANNARCSWSERAGQ